MRTIKTLVLKELRGQMPAFAAFVLVACHQMLFALPLLRGRVDAAMMFYVSGIEGDEPYPFLFFVAIVFFWAGLALFAPEWRRGSMVWLKTLPVRDGRVAAVKIGVGVALVGTSFLLALAARSLVWLLLGGGKNVTSLWAYYNLSVKGVLFVTLLFLPYFLLGALVSAGGRRVWLFVWVSLATWWIVLVGMGVVVAALGLLQADPGDPEVLRLYRRVVTFQFRHFGPSVFTHLAVAVALAAGILRVHSRRQIA